MSAPPNDRAGASLAEAIVALLLGLFVLQLGLATLARVRSTQAQLATRTEALEALRIGRHLIRRELRHARAGEDWSADADSLSLRAFRGVGAVCATDSTAADVTVAYRGDRAPDPSKDSVLLVAADGSTTVRALLAAGTAATPCALLGGSAQRWRLNGFAPRSTVAGRVFERGSYHLSAAALRYRRGASGRQPLTPEVWSTATRWSVAPRRLGVDFVPAASLAADWSGFLAWATP